MIKTIKVSGFTAYSDTTKFEGNPFILNALNLKIKIYKPLFLTEASSRHWQCKVQQLMLRVNNLSKGITNLYYKLYIDNIVLHN